MKNNNKNKEDTFWYKYKYDEKYKAKIQLIGYAVFIVFVIIYINIANIGRNYEYNNVVNNEVDNQENYKDDSNLLDEINNNYNFLVDVKVTKKSENGLYSEMNYSYSGKRYVDNTIINKTVSNNKSVFYKIDDEYYIKENNEYKFIDNSLIYDIINKKYIELFDVKKLIKKASLDHVTTESNGIDNYKYNLLVRDIIQSYKGDDIINIDVNIENDILNINIIYDNLFKQISDDVIKCSINYKYTDINKIEKFVIIDKEDDKK